MGEKYCSVRDSGKVGRWKRGCLRGKVQSSGGDDLSRPPDSALASLYSSCPRFACMQQLKLSPQESGEPGRG